MKESLNKKIVVRNFTNRLAIARFPYIYNSRTLNNLEKMQGPKYSYIHPTKSGGTALDQYFARHYSSWISEICIVEANFETNLIELPIAELSPERFLTEINNS